MGELPASLAHAWRMWADDLVETYEERAGILQFGALLSRDDAEQQAYAMVSRIHWARVEARNEAQRLRPVDHVRAENEALRARVDATAPSNARSRCRRSGR